MNEWLLFHLPAAGHRNTNGTLNNVGTQGVFWSSTPSGVNAMVLNYNSGSTNVTTGNRNAGFSVRCVAELTKKKSVNPTDFDGLLDNDEKRFKFSTGVKRISGCFFPSGCRVAQHRRHSQQCWHERRVLE